MKKGKLVAVMSTAAITSLLMSAVAMAADGDVYDVKTHELRHSFEKYSNNISEFDKFASDMILNTSNLVYEYNDKLYQATDILNLNTNDSNEFNNDLKNIEKDSNIKKIDVNEFKNNIKDLKVESVSAINETAVQVTGLAKEVKETDLAGKKITLKAGDASLTATYVATSLTEDGKANFVLEAEKKLTDAVTYTVSADWASFTTNTFVAKGLTPAYINKVEVLTKAVPSNTAVSNLNLVHFTAKNQYSEDIALNGNVEHFAVKGTINGVPFVANELKGETNLANGIVEINKDLKEGDKVTLTFTNTINGKSGVEVGTVSYTVAKAETAVATTVSDIKAAYADVLNPNEHISGTEAKEVLPGDSVKLTVKVNDQFGNPMDRQSVRWVVEEGKNLIKQTNNVAIEEVKDAVDFTFKSDKAGKVKISAYNTVNGAKVTYEVTVGAKTLNVLNLADEHGTRFNQDENIVKVVTPNEGANLTADQIKFDVKAAKTTVDVTAGDVQVTAKVRGGNADNKNDIVIVVKSTKPGRYTITPYVGESLAKATAKVANGFDVTTTIDQTVASIDDIAFDAAELKTGVEIKKDVTFRNKHKEVVVLEDGELPVETTVRVLPTVAHINERQDDAAIAKVTKIDNKNVLTLKLNDAKLYNVVISQDDVIKSFNLTFASPTLTKVDAGADVTGVVAGDPPTKAKDQAIKFLDQDGKEMPVKANDLRVTVTKPDGQALGTVNHLVKLAERYGFSEAGDDQFNEATGTEIVKGFRVQPNAALAQGVYTVKIANADGKIADTFTVTVGAARVAKTVEVTPVSTSVALNGQTKVKIVPKDQYGEFIANAAGVVIEVVQGDHFAKGNVTPVQNDAHATVAYEVTLTGTTKGTNDVVVNVKKEETVLSTNKVSMTVDSVANLVSSVEVDKTGIKPLYSTKNLGQQVQLKAIVKDASGAVVPVDNNDLSWTIKSVTGKVVADGHETDATVANVGKVGLNTGLYEAAQNFKGTVTIEVTTSNMKVGEITLNLDNAEETAKTGTTKVVNNTPDRIVDADESKAGIQVALDGVGDKDAEANGAITLKLSAVDQYGTVIKTVDFKENAVIAMAGDTSVVKPVVNHNDNTITLTAKGVGTSNVYVQYNGDTITLEVSVNKDAVAAANKAVSDAVKAKIDKLPAKNNVEIGSKGAVTTARADYNKLTADQKALVGDITKLTEAEAKIAELEGQAKQDQTLQEAQVKNVKVEDVEGRENNKKVKVTWEALANADEAGVTGYEVYYKTGDVKDLTKDTGDVKKVSVDAETTSTEVSDLNGQHSFVVYAINARTTSKVSDVFTATPVDYKEAKPAALIAKNNMALTTDLSKKVASLVVKVNGKEDNNTFTLELNGKGASSYTKETLKNAIEETQNSEGTKLATVADVTLDGDKLVITSKATGTKATVDVSFTGQNAADAATLTGFSAEGQKAEGVEAN